jgi:MFS transporter, DHA1 family, multidrug resistance protein
MIDTIREAPVGQFLRWITKNRLLTYPEEQADFTLPEEYASALETREKHSRPKTPVQRSAINDLGDQTPNDSSDCSSDDRDHGIDREGTATECLGRTITASSIHSAPYTAERMRTEMMLEAQKTKSISIAPARTDDGTILVDWYSTDDPANPQNWSIRKKSLIILLLCTYTWTVYFAGPVWAASAEGGLLEEFHVSPVAASLGLALYVLAYGIGDLLFSPLTEIPIVGRNSVYYLTFIVYWALSFGAPTVRDFSGLLALRFWLGFFGSPALANGGATVGDMSSLIYIPYGLCW